MTLAKSRMALVATMLATVCGGPLGCALKTRPVLLPQAPSDEVRARLNTIAVPAGRSISDFQLQASTNGRDRGAVKGAGLGLAAGAAPGLVIAERIGGASCAAGGGQAALGCVAFFLVGLGAAAAGGTVGALGGTVYGAVAAEPAARIGTAETELKSALDGLDVAQALRGHVLRVGRERTALKFVDLEGPGAPASGEYLDLEMIGVDTVLEVDVSSIRLVGDGINPPMRLPMTGSARLVRAADGAELFSERLEYLSPGQHRFLEWAADGGRVFRETVDRGTEILAADIVQLVFQPAD